ncbi:MAG: GIN domain-containing protein, partial [Sphingomonas sp.]
PAAIDRVAIDVRGDTLVISSAQSWGGYPGQNPGPVEISVGTHDLASAWLNGAGSLVIDRVKGLSFSLWIQGSGAGEIGNVAADQMSVNAVGSANVRLAGHAGKLTALMRGISSLDARGLTTPSAAISADGTATIDATVTDTARIDAWGPATIRLAGHPSCTVKVTGSASVSGCR